MIVPRPGRSDPFPETDPAFLFSQQFTLCLKPVVQFLTGTPASCLMNFQGTLPDLFLGRVLQHDRDSFLGRWIAGFWLLAFALLFHVIEMGLSAFDSSALGDLVRLG